jgi:predicted TPR repeat methyltransferase
VVTLPSAYFDEMYAAAVDPWGFASRWYEQRKYALTLAALPEQRYATGFEPGCSIGVLSGLLAERCDLLLSSDASQDAVERAGERLAGAANVTVEQRRLPQEWPDGSYDLVVLSELLYYFDDRDLDLVLSRAVMAIGAGGTLVAAHWRHAVADYPQTGDFVHEALSHHAQGLVRVARHVEADFLLDVYTRPRADEWSAPSVASRAGLV